MRCVFLVVVALAVLRAPAARAGAILYATAASENRVDGFCLRADGSLAPAPTVQVGTAGVQPRRLVVAANGAWTVLYVVEVDRVEAFNIGAHGGLRLLGATPTVADPNANPMDVALSPDMTKLYVPEDGRDRIAAYPLDASGAPCSERECFTSCIKGPKAPQYQRLAVANGFLYVTSRSLGGRVSVFPLAADGSLPEEPSTCARNSSADPTCPCSERRRLDDPKAVLVDGDMLYVESLLKKRILQFTLKSGIATDQSGGRNTQKGCPASADHQFEHPHRKRSPEVEEAVCLKNESTGEGLSGNFRWQKYTSATSFSVGYQDVVRAGNVLLASQFVKARIDAFRLKDDGRLPKHATASTQADVRGSPVGLAQRGNVLYVAGGELDRVQAFRLGRNRGLPERTPFSQTDVLTNSFPNAVATAELTDDCR